MTKPQDYSAHIPLLDVKTGIPTGQIWVLKKSTYDKIMTMAGKDCRCLNDPNDDCGCAFGQCVEGQIL